MYKILTFSALGCSYNYSFNREAKQLLKTSENYRTGAEFLPEIAVILILQTPTLRTKHICSVKVEEVWRREFVRRYEHAHD